MNRNFKKFTLLLILFCLKITLVSSEIIKKIEIIGNERISDETILMFSNISENQNIEVTKLVKKITNDQFMKEYVVGLNVTTEGDVFLRIRKNQFKVLFGKSKDIETKIQNFKAFYKLTKKDSILDTYSLINLKFKNQVVATKKETNGG